jgi:FtsP/CotA-like multicopper oxidase with cupredoxin domain
VLGDTTVCKAPGDNDEFTYAPDTMLPWVHSETIGPFPGLIAYPSPTDLCEQPRDMRGNPTGTGPLQAGEIPNVMPARNCMTLSRKLGLKPEAACRVNEGQLVLTNGRTAAGRRGDPERPGKLTGRDAVIDVMAGQGLRLRLINAAVSRYFWLHMTDQDGAPVTLYRVGGEGGLLDRVRVEGGLQGRLDTKYPSGDIVLGVADRADLVVRVPDDAEIGDVLTLWTLDYQHYGTLQYPFGYGALPTVPVAHLRIVGKNSGSEAFRIAVGDPLRAHPAVNRPIETIKTGVVVNQLLDPATFSVPQPGTDDEELLLTIVGLRESIDGIHGTFLEGGDRDFSEIEHLSSSRFARLGDTLEMSFRNGTQMHHPMHLHGFSFQPVRITDLDDNLVYEYDYNEFVDTVDVPAVHKMVIRVRLEDRPWIDSGRPGGGTGRWLLHCHIFNHAALGMITELVVIDTDQQRDAKPNPR